MSRNFFIGIILVIIAFILLGGAISTYYFKADFSVTPTKPEKFDPSFERLDNVQKLIDYTDSIRDNTKGFDTVAYPVILADVIRNTFIHGYSYYSFKNNWLAYISSYFLKKDIHAIVLPDDILKFPNAACSQQQIVFMEILDRKGYLYRKVEFEKDTLGHFASEIYYNNKWHFFDPNLEPNLELDSSNKYRRFGFEEILKNGLLTKAYTEGWLHELLHTRTYGEPGLHPAPRASLFQKMAKLATLTIWVIPFIAGIILITKTNRVIN